LAGPFSETGTGERLAGPAALAGAAGCARRATDPASRPIPVVSEVIASGTDR
jgi:hypothetical protein